MYVLANPATFMRLSGRVLPWLAALSAATLAVGLYLGFASPADYQQGETAKIVAAVAKKRRVMCAAGTCSVSARMGDRASPQRGSSL